jgi:molybdenum cofactor sulfurtransferase
MAFARFRAAYPTYDGTVALDIVRARDFGRLDRQGHVYLDYTGSSLYAASLVAAHAALLDGGVFGNPHSKNLTSLAMTEIVETTRARVLSFFRADPDEYTAIFTANATGALRLVGEAYPFAADGAFLLTADNHNSVNGIREFAQRSGATVTYAPICAPECRIDADALRAALAAPFVSPDARRLFALPAQSNFTGAQHPLDWIDEAKTHGWDVLLDAAAFAPTNRLDLGAHRPDFVSMSFYKLFGYPTGVGCLIARKSALAALKRPWYSGGTITFSSVAVHDHYLTPDAAGFEDGTVNFLSIPAVALGFDLLEHVGMERIHMRVMCLTGWLIDQLCALRHGNDRPVVDVYGPRGTDGRGATVAFNVLDRHGHLIDCLDVERQANAKKISLRAGCHCNPGAREAVLNLSAADLSPCFAAANSSSFDTFLKAIEGVTTGVVRASLGIASNFDDVFALIAFLGQFVDCEDTAQLEQQHLATPRVQPQWM